MPLCFAYGSNMDVPSMRLRCPRSRPLGLARLPRFRFALMREGYATVTPDPAATVHGLLWDIALADMSALDAYENVQSGLYRKSIQSVLTGQGPRRALVYLGRNAGPGMPKPGYMDGVLAAARAAGLPPDYIAWLGQFAPGAGAAAEQATPRFRAIGRVAR